MQAAKAALKSIFFIFSSVLNDISTIGSPKPIESQCSSIKNNVPIKETLLAILTSVNLGRRLPLE
jgi:hypothetical protein